jgi:hypothetical protein
MSIVFLKFFKNFFLIIKNIAKNRKRLSCAGSFIRFPVSIFLFSDFSQKETAGVSTCGKKDLK